MQDGSLSNELWHYNVHTRIWTLRAKNSPFYPPQLTRHTLTLANDYIYLFGGSTVDGEFSSSLYKIKLNLCKSIYFYTYSVVFHKFHVLYYFIVIRTSSFIDFNFS